MPKANDQAKPARDRGAAVRRRIEAAAVELVAERGWGGVSTRQLAERAGITPGLVHYHYRSLDDALRTAVLAVARTEVSEVARVVAEADDVEQALDLVWSAMDRHPTDAAESVTMIEAMLSALRDDELREGLAVVLHDFRRTVAERLRQGGFVDPEGTAAVLAAVLDGVLLHRMLSDDLGADAVRPVVSRMLQPDTHGTGEGPDRHHGHGRRP